MSSSHETMARHQLVDEREAMTFALKGNVLERNDIAKLAIFRTYALGSEANNSSHLACEANDNSKVSQYFLNIARVGQMTI